MSLSTIGPAAVQLCLIGPNAAGSRVILISQIALVRPGLAAIVLAGGWGPSWLHLVPYGSTWRLRINVKNQPEPKSLIQAGIKISFSFQTTAERTA